MDMTETIGNEEKSAYEGFKTLYSEGFEIRHITTDPDTSAYRAAETVAGEHGLSTLPKNFIDTRHFSENQRKFIKKNEKMQTLMPGRTKADKTKLLGKFATDLSERCHAEYESALNECKGSVSRFKRALSHAVDAIVLCYQGKHILCNSQSFACKPNKTNWIENSKVLPSNFKLNLTIQSQPELRRCVNFRLGPQELEKTKLGTNSQKSECVNKIIRRSLPKRVNYSKNFPGRANSAVHSANHGPGESVVALCLSVGSPVTPGSKVSKSLKQEQHIYENNKKHKKKDIYKIKRKQKTKQLFKLYERHQEEMKYQKGMLLLKKVRKNKNTKSAIGDHDGYSKRA